MRRFSILVLASVLFVALCHNAGATDLPAKPKPAPIIAAPTAGWTGWYAGFNAGGAWENTINNTAALSSCIGLVPNYCNGAVPAVPPQFDTHPQGFIGGGQIGYNWQFNALVFGIETDFQGSTVKGSQSVSNTLLPPGGVFPITVAGTGSQKIDWFGTLRGRVGWLPTKDLLVYATGGLAYGHVQTDVSFSGVIPAGFRLTGSSALSVSDTLEGWTVGGGLEWMFAPRWSVKGEYLYYDLGTVQLNQTLTLIDNIFGERLGFAIQSVAHYHGNIVRAGLNYFF